MTPMVEVGSILAATNSTVSYPFLFWVIMLLGAGGFGAVLWRITHEIHGIKEIVRVLKGTPGGKGQREVPPLVETVDALVKSQDALATKVLELTDQVTPNGKNTNKLGDMVGRMESTVGRIEGRVGQVETKVSQVEDRVGDLQGQTGELATALASHLSEVILKGETTVVLHSEPTVS